MHAHVKQPDPPNPPRRWQFSLQTLLWLCVLASLLCVPPVYFGEIGWVVSAAMLGVGLVGAGVFATRNRTLIWTTALLPWGWVLVVMFSQPLINGPPGPSYRNGCINNLGQIAKALRIYEEDHGEFPPAYITDANGRPMHSWRVLILPYIEERTLYEAYNFDEPWDGPNNIKLHSKIPKIFQCPSRLANPPNLFEETSYMAVVGEQTMWPGAVGRKVEEMHVGLSSTILLVEVHNSGVHWMEPRDLELETMSAVINSGPAGRTISSGHGGGAVVAFADCRTQYLTNEMHSELLDTLLTIDGVEPIPAEFR